MIKEIYLKRLNVFPSLLLLLFATANEVVNIIRTFINPQGAQRPGGYTKSLHRGLVTLFAAVVTFETAN